MLDRKIKWPIWLIVLAVIGWMVGFPMMISRTNMDHRLKGLLSASCVVVGCLVARAHWKERRNNK